MRLFLRFFYRMRLELLKFRNAVRYELRKFSLTRRARRLEPLTEQNSPDRLMVSLTTYGRRLEKVWLTIESLGDQSVKPNRIVLWLSRNEYHGENLPKTVARLEDKGLEVMFCDDLKSYKKIIPSIERFSGWDIITADDDILYPRNFVKDLRDSPRNDGSTLVCHRVHRVTEGQTGSIAPYRNWQFDVSTCGMEPEPLFFTTGAGVLFPSGVMPSVSTDRSLFLDLCPTADDVWLNVVAKVHNIPIARVGTEARFLDNFYISWRDQFDSLTQINIGNDANDYQLRKALDFFEFPETKFLLA